MQIHPAMWEHLFTTLRFLWQQAITASNKRLYVLLTGLIQNSSSVTLAFTFEEKQKYVYTFMHTLIFLVLDAIENEPCLKI